MTSEEINQALQHALQNLSAVLEAYSYILSSCSSLPQSIAWTITVKWHIGRRIESFVRVYTPVLAISRLKFPEASRPRIVNDKSNSVTKMEALGDTVAKFEELLNRLRQLAKLIRSRALSYLSSSILVVLGLLVGFVASNVHDLGSLATNPAMSPILPSLLVIAVVSLALWDLNLIWYVRATTAKVGDKTLMQLEHELYRDALLVLGFKPKRSGIFSIGIAAIEFIMLSLMAIVLVGLVGIVILNPILISDSTIRFLCITVLFLAAMIPVTFGPYVVGLARSLKLARQHK